MTKQGFPMFPDIESYEGERVLVFIFSSLSFLFFILKDPDSALKYHRIKEIAELA